MKKANHPSEIVSKQIDVQGDLRREELDSLHDNFRDQTADTGRQRAMLLEHVELVAQRQRRWLERLTLSPQEKEQLEKYHQRQTEAIDLILQARNQSLKAVGEAQTQFVREVCNSLLLAGRSGMQAAVRVIYTENALRLQERLEALTRQFWELIERKFEDAKERHPLIRQAAEKEAKAMVERWSAQYDAILDEFALLLEDKV
jgi:hypothetical protein